MDYELSNESATTNDPIAMESEISYPLELVCLGMGEIQRDDGLGVLLFAAGIYGCIVVDQRKKVRDR